MQAPDNPAARRPPFDRDALPFGGDLFGELYLSDQEGAAARAAARRDLPRSRFLPGVAVVAVAAGAAAWLAEHYGFPIILLGLLLGLALNFAAREEATHPGLDLASRTCLRWGSWRWDSR